MFEELALPIGQEKMPIRHPVSGDVLKDSEGNEAYVALLHSDSKEGIEARRNIFNKRLRSKAKRTLDDLEEESAQLVAALIVDWHLVTLDGKVFDLEPTAANKISFLKEPNVRWIKDQIDRYAGDLENFLG